MNLIEERDATIAAMAGAPSIPGRTNMTVAIVNHNTREHLSACLATLQWETDDIIVVDNASNDGSVEMVRTRFPRVRVRANDTNLGYGAGANEAVAMADAEYVLVLNSDTHVAPGTVAALARYLQENPQVAMAGPTLLNPDGSLQPSCYPFPTPLNLLLRWTSLGWFATLSRRLRQRYLPTSCHTVARRVDWVVGAALAIRCSAFEQVEGFDESYFMYSEEVDLAYRLAEKGWEIHFVPEAKVVHEGGVSTARYRPEMAAQLFLSIHRFYRRHYSDLRLIEFQLIVTYFMLRNLARDGLRLLASEGAEMSGRMREDMSIWRRVLAAMWSG